MPVAVTLKFTAAPSGTVSEAGDEVITGGVRACTISVAGELVVVPIELVARRV